MGAAKDRLYKAALKVFADRRSKDVTVSDLAREAKVARSTIYNVIPDIDALFTEVAGRITKEFNASLTSRVEGVQDPAIRLAYALALPLEEFHRDPLAGRFVTEFALRESQLRKYWFGVPSEALTSGVETGRFQISHTDIPVFRGQMAGGLLSTMFLIQDGHVGWRDAARVFSSIQLRALGVPQLETATITDQVLRPQDHDAFEDAPASF